MINENGIEVYEVNITGKILDEIMLDSFWGVDGELYEENSKMKIVMRIKGGIDDIRYITKIIGFVNNSVVELEANTSDQDNKLPDVNELFINLADDDRYTIEDMKWLKDLPVVVASDEELYDVVSVIGDTDIDKIGRCFILDVEKR